MVDLAQWLRAQLDADAERARTAAEEYGPDWYYDDGFVLARREDDMVATGSQDFLDRQQGEHVAEWDPARVLREIKAKRKLLVRYEQADSEYAADSRVYDYESEVGRERTRVLGEAVPLAALSYSGRDGYREEWAP